MDKITPKKFEDELQCNIDVIIRKVKNGTYHFTRYKQKLLTKGPEKAPRLICIPSMRDKLTISVLNELLVNVFNSASLTQMPQVIISDIIKDIPEYDYFIKLDIKRFYGSINHDILFKKIRKRIRKYEILELIKKVIETDSISYPVREKRVKKENCIGVPEGLSISNALANIYMSDIDKVYGNRGDIAYYRYVDDILILLHKKRFEEVRKKLEKDIDLLELTYNEKSCEGYLLEGFEYLGYKIYPDFVTARQSSVLKIEQAIEELFQKIPQVNFSYIEWKLNLRITGFILDTGKYGWLFFYSQITDQKLLFHLDHVVDCLLKRYRLEGKIKKKRFVRAYLEMNRALHVTKYIPNLNNYSIDDKRLILTKIYEYDLKGMSVYSIEYLFRMIMKKEIRDLERDVQAFS